MLNKLDLELFEILNNQINKTVNEGCFVKFHSPYRDEVEIVKTLYY